MLRNELQTLGAALAAASVSYESALTRAVRQRDPDEAERAFDEADRVQRDILRLGRRVRDLELRLRADSRAQPGRDMDHGPIVQATVAPGAAIHAH